MEWLAIAQQITRKITIASLTIIIGFFIAKLASRIARKVMAEAELNRILTSAGFKPLSDALAIIIEYLIYAITLLFVLQSFGLTKIVLGIVAIIAIIVICFSLLLAARDFIPNFAAGILLRKKMKPHIGKKIQIGDVKGRLQRFGLIASTLVDKDEHCVPHLYTSRQKITQLRAN